MKKSDLKKLQKVVDGYLPDYDLDCGKFCPDESCFDLFCICLIDGTCILSESLPCG